MNHVKQCLIEYETKLDAVQYRLDESWPEYPSQLLVDEFYRLLDIVNRLKREVKND